MRIRNSYPKFATSFKAFIIILIATNVPIPLIAQISGLWEVTSVQVGSESMTPVA
ncbi:MAG: hypothetical protein JJ895_02240 [Balneolaceae bacterium]|nr:hypothetical protein [Balneolaceae bacterium]